MVGCMALREILVWPDECLKKKAEEIKDIDLHIVTLAEDMTQTMYAAPGVGLAAPQVGISKQLIVLNLQAKTGTGNLMVIINPRIVAGDGKDTEMEMCLSVPNVSVDITRHSRVLVKGIDLKGKEIELEADGLIARVIQHEIDHLNGRVILNYASSLKRSIYLKKAQKSKV